MMQQMLPMLVGALIVGIVVIALLWWIIGRVVKPGVLRTVLRLGGIVGIVALVIFGAPRLLPAPSADMSSGQNMPTAGQGVKPTETTVVEQGRLAVTLNATGNLDVNEQVGMTFQTSGSPVVELLIEPGQTVHAGDPLARLDTTDAEATLRDARIALADKQHAYDELVNPAREVDIAVAQAQVSVAQASINTAYDNTDPNDVESARSQVELARNRVWQQQLSRDDTLETNPEFRSGNGGAQAQEIGLNANIAEAEYNVQIETQDYQDILNDGPDISALSSANADLVQAQNDLEDLTGAPDATDLENGEIDLQNARLGVDRAEAQIAQMTLIAPFDGIVAEENLTVGEFPPSEDAVVLIQNNAYIIDLQIDETDIGQVRVGQSVTLAVDALPDAAITGTITKIEPAPVVDENLVTYIARVTLDPTQAPIRPGMSATAQITTTAIDDALLVPNSFIRADTNTQRTFVTVQGEDGQYRDVEVQIGARNNSESQIVSGLQAGQTIALMPETSTQQQGGLFGPPPGGGPGGGGGG